MGHAEATLLPDIITPAERKALTILIADDDRVNAMVLRAMLQKDGYKVLVAADGQEAVALFESAQPDLILMDVMMPNMDGYEATRRIKELSGERFVPVIFLTALTDDQSLVTGIASGGDDFLTKPFKRVLLRAKIDALVRVRYLYATLKTQKDALAYHNNTLQREYETAEKLFASIVHSGCLNAPYIQYMLSPMSVFNGDLLLAAPTPSGGLQMMIGDFTGHGLPAAIGAIPIADTFYAMTSKGYTVSDLVPEMNRKLRVILPVGVFCSACLMEIDANYTTLTIWNGGLPDVLLYHPLTGELRHIPSQHLPLGILDNSRLDCEVEMHSISPGERLYAYTDGVIEASNPAGEMFGQERLEACFQNAEKAGFAMIRDQLSAFCDGEEQRDDVTLIEITCDQQWARQHHADITTTASTALPAHWQFMLTLEADALRTVNPLPQLIQMIMEIQGLQPHRERLYVIFAELFSNALDHGLLRLDSALKNTSDGFVAYYMEREKRLASLQQGWIRIHLQHKAHGEGGELFLQIADSGSGFDYCAYQKTLEDNRGFSGRGIPLVRETCRELIYRAPGNCVEAVYVWP